MLHFSQREKENLVILMMRVRQARCEEKNEKDTKIMGYLSGVFDIIGVFKRLLYLSNIKIKSSCPDIKTPEF